MITGKLVAAMRGHRGLGLVAWFALSACASSEPDGQGSEPVETAEGGPSIVPMQFPEGGTVPLVGAFEIDLVAPTDSSPSGHASVLGKVYDGPTPSQIVWEEKLVEGDCHLLEPRVPFCEQPCGGSAACVEDDVCQPYPTAQAVGTVTLTGVRTTNGQTQFSMDPIANAYQPTGGIQLPFEPFEEGDAIGLAATGGVFAPFTIDASGVAPLTLSSTSLEMTPEMPIDLEWTAPGISGISSIFVKIDISHHGGTKGMIECTTTDDGSLQIAASLVTRLLDLGVAGFPTIIVHRKSIGATVIEVGRVELVASSSVEREIGIEGLVSCTSTDNCPAGQTCQTDLRCQ